MFQHTLSSINQEYKSKMFKYFESLLRSFIIWHASIQLIAKNKLTPRPTPCYIRHRLENAMVSTLSNSAGIFIHWGVYETGKTTATRHAAQRLQDDHNRTVIFRKGYDIGCLFDPDCDLFARLDFPSSSLAQCISNPTTLIIDHFDSFVWPAAKKNETLMHSLLDMISQARDIPSFNMLLVFNSWESAKEFMDRTDAKLIVHPGCGRWTVDELSALKEITPLKGTRTPEDYDEILLLSTTGGSPSLLNFGLNDKEPLKVTKTRSQIYQNEWTQGTSALTGGTPLGPGRFPDKEGIFHWD
jgi:hypothetical protein